ncbi:MAG: hypothetical protein WDM78_24100 [Puia sp.]
MKLFTQFDQMNITTYSNTKEAGIYNQNYFLVDGKLGYSTNRDVTIGVGTRFEWTRYKPSITSALELRGRMTSRPVMSISIITPWTDPSTPGKVYGQNWRATGYLHRIRIFNCIPIHWMQIQLP